MTNQPQRQPQTDTELNRAQGSNQKPAVHQRPEAERGFQPDVQSAAQRETTQKSRSAQSKLTSTGSPSAEAAGSASSLEEATRDALYQRAAALGINGRSRMTKTALADAIRDHAKR